jgi:hypothetical protein
MLFALLKKVIKERLSGDRSQKEFIVPASVFREIVKSALSAVPVDENWYLDRNPDVRSAVDLGLLSSGRQHFIECGYFEDRLPFAVEVDELFYLNTNPDVRAAHERGEIQSVQAHFDHTGYLEGRQPRNGFSLFGNHMITAK